MKTKIAVKIGQKNLNIINKVKNYADYKRNIITPFVYSLRRQYLSGNTKFSSSEFYQSYPPLNILGMRPTLTRFKVYELDKYIDKESRLLDIGGNVGFFSIYLSRFVKQVTILEIQKDFTNIGKRLVAKEKIDNVSIKNLKFESYKAPEKYDFILSLAVHQYMNYSLDEYLKRLSIILNKKGKVLFETHEREWENLPHKKNRWAERKKLLKTIENNKYFKILKEDYIDDNQGRIRKFYILEKNY